MSITQQGRGSDPFSQSSKYIPRIGPTARVAHHARGKGRRGRGGQVVRNVRAAPLRSVVGARRDSELRQEARYHARQRNAVEHAFAHLHTSNTSEVHVEVKVRKVTESLFWNLQDIHEVTWCENV